VRGGAVPAAARSQQLMKNFLSDERTFNRKVKEAIMALIAERKYSKDQILENYLNEIYLGQRGSQGIFGVWEASQFYFSKPLSELTVGEAALLAGLVRAPNRLSPYRSLEVATGRRNVVLGKLLADQDHPQQYEGALRKVCWQELINNQRAPIMWTIRRELAENYSNDVLTAEDLDFHQHGPATSKMAERSPSRPKEAGILSGSKTAREEDNLEGAIVVLRPQTGEIKAMVGGRAIKVSV
jgi:penicillin-binding protein 1B